MNNKLKLIDSGSHICVRSKSSKENKLNAVAKACNKSIKLYNLKLQSLENNKNLYSYYSYAADIPYDILGMDFILTHVLCLDFERNVVVMRDGSEIKMLESDPPELYPTISEDGETSQVEAPQIISSIQCVNHIAGSIEMRQIMPGKPVKKRVEKKLTINNLVQGKELTDKDFQDLLDKYPQITNEENFNKPPKHKTKHYIKTNGPPVKCKTRRLDAQSLAMLKEVMNDLIKKGIARRSKSNYASPLVLVKRDGKEPRPCGDYSQLNKQTEGDAYGIRHIHDVNLEIHGCLYFSKIDFKKAFNQIPIAEEDIHKTAVTTPIGLYEWLRLPFGLCTASSSFQRFIDEVLDGIKGVFPYQDDVLVYSKTKEEHYEILKQIFDRFAKYGIIVNKDKTELCKEKISVLGYEITAEGIKPSAEKREVIDRMGKPTTEAQLHTFIGIVNYYNRFIPGCSLILAPLYKLFTKKKKCRKEIKWTEEADRAFVKAKGALNDILLVHPDYSKPIAVMIDASDYGIGGVIQQLESDEWRPIQYFARKLSKTEQRYSTFGRELLAAFASVKKFRHHLESREFTLFTDHKALVSAIEKPHLNLERIDREQRQLDFLCSMVKPNRVKHIPGKENIIADCLSRAVNNICFPAEVELLEIYEEQQKDQELQDLDKDTFVKRTIDLPNGKVKLIYNTENGYDRLCIPETKRKDVFDRFHRMSHRGIKASKRYLMHKYYWPNMGKDITEWIRECEPCGLTKSGRKPHAPLAEFLAELDRFHTIHIDIITMDQTIKGCKNVLTMIDRTTCWPEAVPIEQMDAETVAWNLYSVWIKNHGVPKVIVTDQGKQFESELFHALCKLLGSKRCRTTSYHPQTNGKIERFHKTLKEAIYATSPSDWYTALPIILLSLRNTYKEDLEATPSSLVYGRDMVLPNELVFRPNEPNELPKDFAEKLKDILESKKSKKTKPHSNENAYIPKELMESEYVFVKKGQFSAKGQKHTGPHKVVKRTEKTFDIEFKKGQIKTVSIDTLKPAPKPKDNAKSKSTEFAKKAEEKTRSGISKAAKKEKSKDSAKEPSGVNNPKEAPKKRSAKEADKGKPDGKTLQIQPTERPNPNGRATRSGRNF